VDEREGIDEVEAEGGEDGLRVRERERGRELRVKVRG
jgi:hypothetical protein